MEKAIEFEVVTGEVVMGEGKSAVAVEVEVELSPAVLLVGA